MSYKQPVSKFFYSQRLKLHYVDWGNEENPVLILVHGGMDHSRSWDWVSKGLRDKYHVIAPDLRGHGESSWATGSMYSLLDSVHDLSRLIDELEVPSVTIIGHSYGGVVSYLFTGIFPEIVSKLVIVESVGPGLARFQETEDNPLWERMRVWISETKKIEKRLLRGYASIDQAVRRMRLTIPSLTEIQARHLVAHGVRKNEQGVYVWKYDDFSSILSPIRIDTDTLKEIKKRICCPTLLVYGSNGWSGNPMDDPENNTFRFAENECILGAGHWPHHDRLDCFMEKITGFLDKN